MQTGYKAGTEAFDDHFHGGIWNNSDDGYGKLHPQNIKGILDFANARNILLINSSPTTYNVSDYRYTYLLQKDGKSKTIVHPLISQK